MAELFWNLEKRDANLRHILYSSVHWTRHVLQGTRTIRPCKTGRPVFNLRLEKFDYKHKYNPEWQ